MEVRKAGQTVGKYWLSIGFIGLVIGYIYPITGRSEGLPDLGAAVVLAMVAATSRS